jgi:hypothetical protein
LSCIPSKKRNPIKTPANSHQKLRSGGKGWGLLVAQGAFILEFRYRGEDRAAQITLHVFRDLEGIIPVFQEEGET